MLDYQSPARAFEDPPAGFEYASERLAREARVFDLGADTRSEQSNRYGMLCLAIYVVLAAIFIGAITPQAVENIKAWEAANAPV